MKQVGTKTLETGRLILRQFHIDDASAMYKNWACDPEVTKYLMWATHDNVENSKSVLSDWISQYTKNDFYLWAIVMKENGDEPIGSMAIVHKNDEVKMVHIGYCIGKKWWNQGITSEAFSAVIKFLFDTVGANRIESRHDPKNPNSGKVMIKCGLQYEGTMRESDWNNQGICDASMYAILQKDYE